MIPILLVTGFLGSGKTTFINWLLEKQSDLKISIILNEFGDTKLETQFVKQHSEDIMELANGCMCCVAKSDIPRVISYILEHSPQTEYIVIEASGLSDPDPVRDALQTPPVSDSAYLESTICLIDAVNFQQMRMEHGIINSQIADSDLVLINKKEAAGPEQTAQVATLIDSLAPDIRVIEFADTLPPEIFLTKTGPRAQATTKHAHEHTHEAYDIFVYETEKMFDISKLQAVVQQLPPEIIRIKGVVQCPVSDGVRMVRIQRVGAHVSVEPHQVVQPLEQSTILCIGTQLDRRQLTELLDSAIC